MKACKLLVCAVFFFLFFSAFLNPKIVPLTVRAAGDHSFGYTSIGGGSAILSDYIRGSIFTFTKNSIKADSISVALKRSASGTEYVNCALYNSTSLSKIAQTTAQPVSLTTSFVFYTFNFANPKPNLVHGASYLLVGWASTTGGQTVSIAWTTGSTNQGAYKSSTYTGNFPDTISSPTYEAKQFSIYCTYTLFNLNVTSTPVNAGFSLNGTYYTSPKTFGLENGTYQIIFNNTGIYGTRIFDNYTEPVEQESSTLNFTIEDDVITNVTANYKMPLVTYRLIINSNYSPIPFTLNGFSETTPFDIPLVAENYTVIMPNTATISGDVYLWNQWGDGDNSTTRTVNLTANTTLSVIYIPISGESSNNQYFFRDNTHTVNNVTGYDMQESNGAAGASVSQNLGAVNGTVQWGFTIYAVNMHGNETCLSGSNKIAVLSRVNAGAGFQTSTFTVPNVHMILGYGSIEIKCYVKLGAGSWVSLATFTTDRLLKKGLISSAWNFTLYTEKKLSGSNIIATISFGDSTHKSGVSGIDFVEPSAQEVALYYAQKGDFITAMLYPYMLLVGDLIYGIGLIFVGGVLYLRHKKWETFFVFMLLFGGASTFGFLIPNVTYRIIYFLFWFILAISLYRVFKS